MRPRNKFPYKVFYPRTINWWNGGGDWYQLSHYVSDVLNCKCGIDWDYIDNHFVFVRESDQMMFLLRWK